MTNINFKSEVAIKDILNLEASYMFSQTFGSRIEDKHILVSLDEKYHNGIYALEECLFPHYYNDLYYLFGFYMKRQWMFRDGPISHIKEKDGTVYVIMQRRHVARLKYSTAWYLENPFILQHTFEADGPCTCLAHFRDGVVVCNKFPPEFVSATSTPQLHIYDSTGTLRRHIVYNNSEPIFNDPQDIAVNANDTIIVSDEGDKSVIFLSEDGDILYKFKHKEMSNPRALCIDQFSNIYITAGDKVIQLMGDHSNSRVIIALPNQQMSFAHFCVETNLLSVSYDGTGKRANYQFLQNNEITNKNRENHKKSMQIGLHPSCLAGLFLLPIILLVSFRLIRDI